MKDFSSSKTAMREALELVVKTGRVDAFALLPSKMDRLMGDCAVEMSLPLELDSKIKDLQARHRSGRRDEIDRFSKSTPAELILTARETEILSLAAQGLTNREIANKLVVSLNTVKTHMYNASQKLEAGNRTEAVFYAKSLGII